MAGNFEPLRVLGCMSGTSLDGVDAAILTTDGVDVVEAGASAFRPYSDAERRTLSAALGQWSGPAVDAAAKVVVDAHAELCATMDFDVLGFHGQTLAHDPQAGRTLQAGSGEALAHRCNRQVVWDFRSGDMAAGGQGAPLAPFYHFALARRIGATEPVAFLNLGGVANVTWVDPARPRPEDDGALIAFDTGPASALIDDFVAARTGARMDTDGALATRGGVDEQIVRTALAHPFVARSAPKSLDRNSFAPLLEAVAPLGTEDGAATLTAVSARMVAAGARHLPSSPTRWLVCGGGRRNPALMAALGQALGVPVEPVEAVGLDGDMIEAQAFAYLAVRVLRGLPTSAPGTTGCRSPHCGGRIARVS